MYDVQRMAKIDKSLYLNDAEIDRLMTTETRCRIATIGPGEHINLTPMTFGWAAGKVYLFARGQKIANLRKDPRATIEVDVGNAWRELKGVMLQGTAQVLEDAEAERADPSLTEAMQNISAKHGRPFTASAAGRSRRWIVFTPTRKVSWNNEKL